VNSAAVIEEHRRAGRAFRAGGVGSFVREQGAGEEDQAPAIAARVATLAAG